MIRATVREVQTDLPRYLAEVARGEIIELIEHEQPIAELRGLPSSPHGVRRIGLGKGTFEVPASFFEPLPNDLLDAFNGDAE